MYKLDIPVDMKESAAIERRRNQELQRQSRIFNAKTRLIGVDVQAMEQQVKDRKKMEEMELQRHQSYASDAIRNDKIAHLLEKRQQHDTRELDVALNDFRYLHQQPDGRREWDLYDPDGKKKDKPARVNDDDPRCTISGLQKLDGEDLNNQARSQFQREQMREWAEQKMRENNIANQNQKRADHLYELKMRELDQRACELQDAEMKCRRAIDSATSDYNRALAKETDARRSLQRKQELDDNSTEIANNIYGDLLTENPAVATSAFGANRVVPDRWKGMSPEQIGEIRRTQELQAKENERRRQEQRLQDEEWDRQRTQHARAGILLDRERDRREKDLQKQIATENKRLGQEQKAHLDYLDKEVYKNPPTASYFMQFNTSTR